MPTLFWYAGLRKVLFLMLLLYEYNGFAIVSFFIFSGRIILLLAMYSFKNLRKPRKLDDLLRSSYAKGEGKTPFQFFYWITVIKLEIISDQSLSQGLIPPLCLAEHLRMGIQWLGRFKAQFQFTQALISPFSVTPINYGLIWSPPSFLQATSQATATCLRKDRLYEKVSWGSSLNLQAIRSVKTSNYIFQLAHLHKSAIPYFFSSLGNTVTVCKHLTSPY